MERLFDTEYNLQISSVVAVILVFSKFDKIIIVE